MPRNKWIIFFKGFCMGIADIVPGVSGGTIAFLAGIYEDLIDAIASFDAGFLRDILRLRIRDAFARTKWRFLSSVLAGIMSAVFIFSRFLNWVFDNYPIYIKALFFGIILVTIFVIWRKIKKRSALNICFGILGAILMLYVSGVSPLRTSGSLWFLFFSGALAICAMILPGISGAFILLLLGKYEYMIAAVSNFDLLPLAVFSFGCAFGIFSFIRVLRWLLDKYYNITISVLAGFVTGSLPRIWPWRGVFHSASDCTVKILALDNGFFLPGRITSEAVIAGIMIMSGVFLGLCLAALDKNRCA